MAPKSPRRLFSSTDRDDDSDGNNHQSSVKSLDVVDASFVVTNFYTGFEPTPTRARAFRKGR